MLQSWPFRKYLASLWVMEEIYANVDSRTSTKQTGKNVAQRSKLSSVLFTVVSLTVFTASLFRLEELTEEISWSCFLSGAVECFPAGWTHRPRCPLWVCFTFRSLSQTEFRRNVLQQDVYFCFSFMLYCSGYSQPDSAGRGLDEHEHHLNFLFGAIF